MQQEHRQAVPPGEPEHYTPILAEGQVPYMLKKFQSEAAIEDQIAHQHNYYLMIDQGNFIGYFDFVLEKDAVFISKIYVLKSERGKGFAKKALNFISERAKEHRLLKLRLTANEYNSLAILAYEKSGFKNVKAVVMDIGSGYVMDDFVFESSL